MTNIPHKPIGEPDNGADRAKLRDALYVLWRSGRDSLDRYIAVDNALEAIDNYFQAQKAAQPQPLNDGERLAKCKAFLYRITLDMCQRQPGRTRYMSKPVTNVQFAEDASERYLVELLELAAHSPSTEAAVLPEFAKPGGVIPYEEIRGKRYVDLDWLIKQLEQQRAALESVTTDEGDE